MPAAELSDAAVELEVLVHAARLKAIAAAMLNASAFFIVFLLCSDNWRGFVRTRLTLFMVKENDRKNKGEFHRQKCEKIIHKKQCATKQRC